MMARMISGATMAATAAKTAHTGSPVRSGLVDANAATSAHNSPAALCDGLVLGRLGISLELGLAADPRQGLGLDLGDAGGPAVLERVPDGQGPQEAHPAGAVALDDASGVLCPRGEDSDGADTTVDGDAEHALQTLAECDTPLLTE